MQDAATSLTYMQQRYYDPQIGMFLSVDPVTAYSSPIGQFNRYRYANGNPYRYTDPDGRIAGVDDLVVGVAIGAAIIGLGIYIYNTDPNAKAGMDGLMGAIGDAASNIGGALLNESGGDDSGGEEGRRAGKDNAPRSDLPRDESGNYLPLDGAEGAHTTLGTREGSNGESYTQGATFDEKGEFQGRTDVTDHGRRDHTSPHYHPATGPNSVERGGRPIDSANEF